MQKYRYAHERATVKIKKILIDPDQKKYGKNVVVSMVIDGRDLTIEYPVQMGTYNYRHLITLMREAKTDKTIGHYDRIDIQTEIERVLGKMIEGESYAW
jgi:hypothetical protein